MNRSISSFTSVLATAALTLSAVNSFATPVSPNASANKFAVKLLKGLQAQAPQENVVVSPTSLTTVFSLVTAGAAPEDQKTILRALNYETTSMEDVLKDSAAFEKALVNTPDYAVTSQNAIFTNVALDKSYEKSILTSLNANHAVVKFDQPETATAVNAWAEKSTDGLIKEIVKSKEIEKLSFLGLNATFLKAKWGVSFDSPYREGAEFTGDDGKPMMDGGQPVKVALMTSNPSLPIVAVEYPEYTVYDIPYKVGANGKPQGSFQILLPNITNKEDVKKSLWGGGAKVDPKMATVGEVVASLTDESIDQMNADIETKRVQRGRSFMVHIPKFKAEYTAEHSTLESLFTAWGAGSIFKRIDMSGMVAGKEIKDDWTGSSIALIKQKATIEVSETGTKAAAVSAIGGFPESCPPPQVYMNRPFAYFVRDAATGRIIFAGTYMNPLKATLP